MINLTREILILLSIMILKFYSLKSLVLEVKIKFSNTNTLFKKLTPITLYIS